MVAAKPLEGMSLISCAQANAKYGCEVAALQCGYGEDIERFSTKLNQACQETGIHIDELSDMIPEHQRIAEEGGIEIYPDPDLGKL